MTVDSQLRMRDIEGFYDTLSPHPKKNEKKRNNLDRKSFVRTVKSVIKIPMYSSSQLIASSGDMDGEGLSIF